MFSPKLAVLPECSAHGERGARRTLFRANLEIISRQVQADRGAEQRQTSNAGGYRQVVHALDGRGLTGQLAGFSSCGSSRGELAREVVPVASVVFVAPAVDDEQRRSRAAQHGAGGCSNMSIEPSSISGRIGESATRIGRRSQRQ